MMWEATELPTYSGGTIITHLSDSTETFYCRVLTGDWDHTFPESKELGPYDTYEKALIALTEYGSELLESDMYALEEIKKFIGDINEVRQDGIAQGILQTAKTMKSAGFSVKDIIKATNLTADKIRRL